MIQCKFGEKSRQVSLFASQRILTSLVIPVSTFSLRVSGRSSFLPILSHYLPYLNISDGETKPGCEGTPPSLMSLQWMMVFQGCEKYLFKIATDIQLLQHAATDQGFLPVILLPVSSLFFRLPGRSCIFCPS